MQIYLAPMEGLTDYIVRNAFHHNFGCIDKYFTPFIPAANRLGPKLVRDLIPENNQGMELIPQMISKDASEIPVLMEQLEVFGYKEFNFNIGCPSGTVAGKNRGSGMLKDPASLDAFLSQMYKEASHPISIKTRIGFHSADEWPAILKLYEKYPIQELIIHPRVREEFYSGTPHMDAFALAYDRLADSKIPLCYNGDVTSPESFEEIASRFPKIHAIMIGRGLLSRPDLCCKLKGVTLSDPRKNLRAFYNEMYEGFLAISKNEKDVIDHTKELWTMFGKSFKDSRPLVREILMARQAEEFQKAVDKIFDTLELAEW